MTQNISIEYCKKLAQQQTILNKEGSIAERFTELLNTLLIMGKAYLTKKNGETPKDLQLHKIGS